MIPFSCARRVTRPAQTDTARSRARRAAQRTTPRHNERTHTDTATTESQTPHRARPQVESCEPGQMPTTDAHTLRARAPPADNESTRNASVVRHPGPWSYRSEGAAQMRSTLARVAVPQHVRHPRRVVIDLKSHAANLKRCGWLARTRAHARMHDARRMHAPMRGGACMRGGAPRRSSYSRTRSAPSHVRLKSREGGSEGT